jgi:hypothetical protein
MNLIAKDSNAAQLIASCGMVVAGFALLAVALLG